MKRKSDAYLKVVEWSEEDECYIGTAPGLFLGGVHGKRQDRVFRDLCDVVEETVALMEKEGKPLPRATANKKFSGKVPLRIPPQLHKSIAVKALQEGTSINRFIANHLKKAV